MPIWNISRESDALVRFYLFHLQQIQNPPLWQTGFPPSIPGWLSIHDPEWCPVMTVPIHDLLVGDNDDDNEPKISQMTSKGTFVII